MSGQDQDRLKRLRDKQIAARDPLVKQQISTRHRCENKTDEKAVFVQQSMERHPPHFQNTFLRVTAWHRCRFRTPHGMELALCNPCRSRCDLDIHYLWIDPRQFARYPR